MKTVLLVALLSLGYPDLPGAKKKLASSNDRERAEAVEELAELDVDEAWDLVIDALSDPEAQVADAAQLVLGEARSDHVAKELAGKRGVGERQELVLGRVLEALGRSPRDVSARLFVKPVGHKEADVRLRALWSVERLAARGKLELDSKGKLSKAIDKALSKDRDPLVRAAALRASCALSDEPSELVQEGLLGSEPAVRIAAIDCALVYEPERALGIVRLLSVDEAPEVRRALIDAYRALASAASARALVDALEREENLRNSWRIVECLQELSGSKHRRDARPWRAWADGLAGDWKPGEERGAREYDRESAALVGMPILSENVVFLIDFSGSTWMEREGEKTRKSRLDAELRRALEALPPTTNFNVVPYTGEPIPWEDALVPATERNVKRALEFFESCKASGPGDFLEAALHALRDPDVDTVMVLTDGAPTGGEHWNLRLLVPWLVQKNQARRVVFDSLLVDASRRLEAYWRELAETTGGRSRSVRL